MSNKLHYSTTVQGQNLMNASKEDIKNFEKLCEKVQDIDPQAYHWLRMYAPQRSDFAYSGYLAECFTWENTAQGQDYWYKLWSELFNLMYK